jgi:WD repeat-containing protein 40A
MAIENEMDIIAIGSQSYITIIDPRSSSIVTKIPSQDSDWGVRSLSFNGNIISIGGGQGHLSFFNIKAGKYLELVHNQKNWYSSSKGWLHRDDSYYTYFNGMDIPNAIHTHSYSPSKTKIFAGGGPLMVINYPYLFLVIILFFDSWDLKEVMELFFVNICKICTYKKLI